jgi:hypothetical protein
VLGVGWKKEAVILDIGSIQKVINAVSRAPTKLKFLKKY